MSGFLPDAEWGAMDIRKVVLLSKLPKRNLSHESRITQMGYAQFFFDQKYNFFENEFAFGTFKAICLLLGPPNGMVCVMKTPMRLCAICIIGIIS